MLREVPAQKNTRPVGNADAGVPQQLSPIRSVTEARFLHFGDTRSDAEEGTGEVGPGGDCPSVTPQHLFQMGLTMVQ